jgi:flagellar biosynthesis regulator FlaF
MLDFTGDIDALRIPEEKAQRLAEAALFLDRARAAELRDAEMAVALDGNLQLWVMIRTLAEGADSAVSGSLRTNLTKLCDYVARTTLREGVSIDDDSLDSLININLCIAEGLVEGARQAA